MSEPPPEPHAANANPYAPTAHPESIIGGEGTLSPAELKKVEAIIKDANQFWLAILICFLCSALGMLLIGPWYLVRLLQWNTVSQSHPELLDPAAAPGSLAQRFQSARWKLIVGLVVGGVLFLLVFASLALISVTA